MITDFPVKNELVELLKNKSKNSQNEICGFLKKHNGFYNEFLERKNIHPDPKNYFLVSPKECIFEEDIILFHSHPEHIDLIGFSEWDIENQKYFCLNMLVYSVNNDSFYYKSI